MKSESMNLKEVATEDLVAMLRHVSVETGSLTCPGCGHEHSCGTRGCALIREAADRLDASRAPTLTPPNEPLTQADVDKMHFDRVWIDYGTGECSGRDGEEGVILYGKLYSIDTLDGAGLEDLLLDATGHGADTLDNPSGNYTVCRRPPEEEWNEPLTLDELREMVGCWVWVIVTYQHEGKTFQCDGWALVETPARIAYLDQEFQLTELGTRFRAYKHQVSDCRVHGAPNDL